MKEYIKVDPWRIIEDGFKPEYNEITESLMSIGNGRFGTRGNFEETFTGKTLQGSYVAGVYFPDKTKVGWWKNGYPRYFAKVLNSCNWAGFRVFIDKNELDLATCQVRNFRRVLDMKQGVLKRSFIVQLADGNEIEIETLRFCSMAQDDLAFVSYSITPLNNAISLKITPFLDGDIQNKDSNYEEKFWDEIAKDTDNDEVFLQLRTKENPYGVEQFDVATGMHINVTVDDRPEKSRPKTIEADKFIGRELEVTAAKGKKFTIEKTIAITTSQHFPKSVLLDQNKKILANATKKTFDDHLREHVLAWANKWESNDVIIEGDDSAQQGIRFNIFHLNQTYTGKDERLNIGPKGFTGEKYGGSTYWDTEAYCIPFYMATAPQNVARQLLIYRFKQLQPAIDNACKNLGFTGGAALYPMVTMTGEECHNEWEITFEEIHRNGAIAYAIYYYVNYTQDTKYLGDYGLEVLIGIARFWCQRVNFSEEKQKYVILGVTGPNEYENNVNNNFYTNYLAAWCLRYTLEAIETVSINQPEKLIALFNKIQFNEIFEVELMGEIVDKMYLPENEKLGVFMQQDGFMDKVIMPAADLDPLDRPLNQNWSWDRILRSCFIKQADVLQGLYFFEDEFSIEEIKRNFDFYEPLTVHESSLSPCVHAILASKLGYFDKAYEMYLRTARLDLDDYNNDTEDGLHITSMAGTWMSVVIGFGGMRIKNQVIHINPMIPAKWSSFSFRMSFGGSVLKFRVGNNRVEVENFGPKAVKVEALNKQIEVSAKATQIFE